MPTPVPALETSRLILRPFTLDDIDTLQEVLSVDGVLRYFPRPTPPDHERAERVVRFQIEHWEKYGYGQWALSLPGDDRFIGWCGLQYLTETDEIEIGYLLGKPFWGKGLATEASIVGQRWAFGCLDLQTLIAIVHPENAGSIRVAEKLGMTRTARTVYFGMDCYRYAITRVEYRNWVSQLNGASQG